MGDVEKHHHQHKELPLQCSEHLRMADKKNTSAAWNIEDLLTIEQIENGLLSSKRRF